MAKRPDPPRETTPPQFPEVTPPTRYRDAVDIGWLAESMMQLQKSMGEVSANVKHLSDSTSKQGSKLDKISHILFAAGVVLAIFLTVASFFMKDVWHGINYLMNIAPK